MIMKLSLLLSSVVAALVVASICPQTSLANQGLPDFIDSYDEVQPQIGPGSSGTSRRSSGDIEISFDARGRNFRLQLVPANLLANGAEIVRVTDSGIIRETPRVALYAGSLADDPSAIVRVTINDDGIDGVILVDGEMIFLEPVSRYRPAPSGTTLVYAGSETNPVAMGCGVEGDDFDLSSSQHRRSNNGAVPGLVGAMGLLEIGMVGDFELFQKHGAGTAGHILTLMNMVDAIYTAEVNVTMAVTQVVIFETSNDPFSNGNGSGDLLKEFSTYRGLPGSPVGDTGLAHLLTGKNLAGSMIGIAWVGTLCDDNFGTGLSEDYTPNNSTMTLLISHEIGHNFGARHDGDSAAGCGGIGSGFIMWPSIGGGMNDSFSTCSQNAMEIDINAASCILPAIPVGCGNGILAIGEECDDGNNVGGDCCRFDCKFENAGGFCAGDGNVCTDDVCDGFGGCEHPDNNAFCDDGDICTAFGQCGGGSCQASLTPMSLRKTKFKAKFKPGPANDKLVVKAFVPTDGWISAPSAEGTAIEITNLGSPVWTSDIPGGSGWSALGSRGTSFRYLGDAGGQASIGGVSKLQVNYKLSKGLVLVKLKTADFELADLTNKQSLGLRIQIGDSVSGDCGELPSFGCSVKPDIKIKCSGF
ncbi:MAG: cysteine-rich repeat protein [Hyphomicrobiaceae bacterium]|jgi:cysteine-rich repeat protein